MGALVTKALRPIKSFNIENRVHRVISKEKPTAAPLYPQNVEDLKRTIADNPDLDEKLDKKHEDLDDWLKNVYVTSQGKAEDDVTREMRLKREASGKRPLPQDRKMPPIYEFGFKEPDYLKYGTTTLKNAITFLSAHQADPEQVTPTKIAFEYKLKEEDVQDVLTYFKTFEVFAPATKDSPAVFAGPAMIRKQLAQPSSSQLSEGNETEKVQGKDRNLIKN